MNENELNKLIDEEISNFTWAKQVDTDCFVRHRIQPRPIKLALDTDGKILVECMLVTDHNGKDDSPYRVAYDPEHGQFVREVTLKNGVFHYIGRFPSLEDLVDEFA